ncbi:MAG: type II toxin-antitoxin system VapC family toxin [Chromatiales bacterium]|nr:type II toxin-antitoxin system VapC family toxin [Chromatiales bacterium]
MNLLLDTHLLLWSAGDPARLSGEARGFIEDESNALHFSAASIWEIVIKNGLGRPDFQVDTGVLRRCLLDNGYAELGVTSAHAIAVGRLAPVHRDPFDRMLVAQAETAGVLLLTSDARLGAYSANVRIV